MSYSIIKSIVVKDGKVILRASSNNVSPKDYDPWECPSLTKILAEEGQEAFDLEVFREYESGMFQGGNNKWTRALMVLRKMPEYKEFVWYGEPYEEISKRRKTPEFIELLKKALLAPLSKTRFICIGTGGYFVRKLHRSHYRTTVYWTSARERAKIFRMKEEIDDLKSCFTGGESWTAEPVARNERSL